MLIAALSSAVTRYSDFHNLIRPIIIVFGVSSCNLLCVRLSIAFSKHSGGHCTNGTATRIGSFLNYANFIDCLFSTTNENGVI